MTEHPATRTIEALSTVMERMQFLVEHPRMQQKRWVASGKRWLPVLEAAHQELAKETEHYKLLAESHQALWDVMERLGLEIKQRDRETWAYSWRGTSLTGAYPSRAQALEAALYERLK